MNTDQTGVFAELAVKMLAFFMKEDGIC